MIGFLLDSEHEVAGTAGHHLRRSYPSYRHSGVQWIGDIPAHWQMKRLKYAALPSSEKLITKPDELPYLGLEHVEQRTGRLLLDNLVESVDSSVALFEAGCVLFGKLRPYLAKVVHTEFRGVCTGEFLVLQPNCGVHGRFIFYLLLSEGFIGLINAMTYGAKMPRASSEQVGNVVVPIPTLEEQEAVGVFLDRETAKIATLIGKKERLIELLQEKRTALISRAVTWGLDPTVPMKPSGVEWLGEIPAHWIVTRLMYLTPDHRPIMYGIVLPGPNVDDGVPIVKGGDVTPERLRLELVHRTTHEIEAGYVRSRLQGGDLVYAIRGSIGMVEIVPPELEGANLTQDAARVAPRSNVHRRWLLYALKSRAVFSQLDAGAMGATIRGINIRDLKRAVMPLPPSDEQNAIASFLDQETARLEALIAKVRQHIERLREYRTALISAAVTGKIDVRGEVP
jgi:type I restriction enzyme, S subunit